MYTQDMSLPFAFISYSHRDSELTKHIAAFFEHRGIAYWYDKSLHGAGEWSEELAGRIKCCALFVAMVSNKYIASRNCLDEWEHAIRNDKPILMVRLDESPLTNSMEMEYGRYQYLTFTNTTAFFDSLLAVKPLAFCRSIGYSDRLVETNELLPLRDYDGIIRRQLRWLMNLKTHWATLDTGTVAQNANTCEVLYAMKRSGYDRQRPETYRNAFNRLREGVTENGLSSKSLGRETVVVTSMLLLLVAMEREAPIGIIQDYQFYETLAERLWDIRNEEAGWGVYMENMDADQCSNANTFWALRALCCYDVGATEQYRRFCRQIYEAEADGTFGFFSGGSPRLVPTAMLLCLLYAFAPAEREEIMRVYDIKAGIDYLFRKFVEGNVQVELETLYGIDRYSVGAKKVPWTHIAIGFVTEALCQARLAGELSDYRMARLAQRLDRILNENVHDEKNGAAYYHPEGMETSRSGRFTFPTAYMITALCWMTEANCKVL